MACDTKLHPVTARCNNLFHGSSSSLDKDPCPLLRENVVHRGVPPGNLKALRGSQPKLCANSTRSSAKCSGSSQWSAWPVSEQTTNFEFAMVRVNLSW